MDLCVVCRNREAQFRPFWSGLKQCCNCGHCVADINSKDLNFKNIYKDSYFSGDEYSDYLRDRPVFEKQFQSRLNDIFRFKKRGKLIEIGCAYGFFLAVAKGSFSVKGFDIAEGPTTYAREVLGVDAQSDDFLDAQLEPESVDIIVMWDVIEHLPRPDLTVEKAAKILRPGGLIFITTGDIGSILAKLMQEKWRLIHPPTHLNYFNRKSISEMLANFGMDTIEIKSIGSRRSLRQIAYSLLALGKDHPSSLYRFIEKSSIGDFSFVLNTYDIMLVVGQKKSI